MEAATWGKLWAMVAMTVAALLIGVMTKPGPKIPNDVGYIFRRYARTGGLMIGIGGWVIVAQLLIMLLTDKC
jgi:hypothetical protein